MHNASLEHSHKHCLHLKEILPIVAEGGRFVQGSTANVCMSIKVTGTFPALRRRVSESENTSLVVAVRPTLNGRH